MLKSYESKSIEIGGKKYTEYEAQQILRYYERTRRKYKREFVMNKAAGLDTASASVKLRSYNEKIKHVEQITGLSHLGGNMTVVGYGRHEAKVATKESREFYNAFKRAYSLNAEGMPKTLASYYDMKYNNSPEYKVFKKYVLSIERGEISPLLGLSTYKEKVHQIDEQLIGLKTPQGAEIKDYSSHFVGRMIGHSAPNKKYNRTGVSVEDLKRCITQGEERTSGHEDTIMLIGSGCQVTYNPKTGVLVQTNRKDREI